MIARDCASRVPDFAHELLSVTAAPGESDPDAPAIRCELDRVPDQIPQHVFDLITIRVYCWEIVAVEPLDGKLLFRGEWLIQRPNLVDQLRDVEVGTGENDLVARAAHVGENLVDHVDQLLAAVHDAGNAVPLLLIQLAQHPIAQYLGVRDDSGEWGAKIVRDVGEKLGL